MNRLRGSSLVLPDSGLARSRVLVSIRVRRDWLDSCRRALADAGLMVKSETRQAGDDFIVTVERMYSRDQGVLKHALNKVAAALDKAGVPFTAVDVVDAVMPEPVGTWWVVTKGKDEVAAVFAAGDTTKQQIGQQVADRLGLMQSELTVARIKKLRVSGLIATLLVLIIVLSLLYEGVRLPVSAPEFIIRTLVFALAALVLVCFLFGIFIISTKRNALGGWSPLVPVFVGLLAGLIFVIARYAYGAFYSRFDVTPEDVGLGYQALLGRIGLQAAMVIGVVGLVTVGVVGLVTGASWKRRLAGDFPGERVLIGGLIVVYLLFGCLWL